jgi:hypothetical protein
MASPHKVFISYSHNQNDRPLLDKLLLQLAPLINAGKISVWEDSQISPGQAWDDVIKENLNVADIVVMLVSSDYTASNYINQIEVPISMQRQAAGDCKVVPVLLRSCLFELMPYSKYEFLPKTADNQRLVPVDSWEKPDEALAVVVRRLHQLIKQGNESPNKPPLVDDNPNSMQEHHSPISDLERKGYELQLTLATEKLQHLQMAALRSFNASEKFSYEHEIKQLETLIAELKSKL